MKFLAIMDARSPGPEKRLLLKQIGTIYPTGLSQQFRFRSQAAVRKFPVLMVSNLTMRGGGVCGAIM